jgi:AcrR family transcriptional regulator
VPRMSAADRRDKLIDAAIAVMSREGVANTTTRAIVAEAGMQIGVFHYCFRSKDELIAEVARRINDRSFAAVSEVLSRTDDPSQLIRLCIDAYWRHVDQNPLERLLIFELTNFALRQPAWEQATRAAHRFNIDSLAALLTAVAEAGSFTWRSPVDVVARFVLAHIEGVTFQWLVHRDVEAAGELFDKLVEWLDDEAGLRAPTC